METTLNTCKWQEPDDYCFNMCEGKTDYCARHNRLLRKIETDQQKANEKRKALLSAPKKVYKAPNKVSEKRKEANKEYAILREQFLKEHPECEIRANELCTGSATTIHHPAGRIGDLFLDVTKWKGACMSCHVYVENHPQEAKERGWSESRLAKDEPHKI